MSFASTHYLSQTLKVTCDLIDEVDYFNGKFYRENAQQFAGRTILIFKSFLEFFLLSGYY